MAAFVFLSTQGEDDWNINDSDLHTVAVKLSVTPLSDVSISSPSFFSTILLHKNRGGKYTFYTFDHIYIIILEIYLQKKIIFGKTRNTFICNCNIATTLFKTADI